MDTIGLLTIILFFICFYGLITAKRMIKSVVFIVLMQSAVILFFLRLGFRNEITPPIGAYFDQLEYVADPLPQALMITAIVVGIAVITINITMLISLFREYKTVYWDVVKQRSME